MLYMGPFPVRVLANIRGVVCLGGSILQGIKVGAILDLFSLQIDTGSFRERDDIARLNFYPGPVCRLIELNVCCGRVI
jgi:hypothetical protein